MNKYEHRIYIDIRISKPGHSQTVKWTHIRHKNDPSRTSRNETQRVRLKTTVLEYLQT